MKLALLSSPRCPDPQNGSKRLGGAAGGLLGAFLFRLCEREVEKELESYFRVTEAMGLNPNGAVPGLLSSKLDRIHSLVSNLTGVTFPLQPTQNQQQPQP